jgi:hypothetical protein
MLLYKIAIFLQKSEFYHNQVSQHRIIKSYINPKK